MRSVPKTEEETKDRINGLFAIKGNQSAESFHRRHILADLRALEKMSTVQSGAQDEVSL